MRSLARELTLKFVRKRHGAHHEFIGGGGEAQLLAGEVEKDFHLAARDLSEDSRSFCHLTAKAALLATDDEVEITQVVEELEKPRAIFKLRATYVVVYENEIVVERPAPLRDEVAGVCDLALARLVAGGFV